MEKSIFNNLHKAIKIRLVYEVLSKIKANHRIPFEIIESFCDGNKNNSGGVNFFYTKDKVFINNIKNEYIKILKDIRKNMQIYISQRKQYHKI